MTRDQAIRCVMNVKGWGDLPDHGPRWKETAESIDCLVALGLLTPTETTKEPITLCGEDPDWNWWLAQSPAFKAAAVKQIRARPVPGNGERVLDKLQAACQGVPYLATCMQITLDNAGLTIVDK